ncbi:hypothetical protein AB0L06_06535 [Spirillospora sp. NPDC052269]
MPRTFLTTSESTGLGRALLAVVDAEKPPTHLILGSDALSLVADARSTFEGGSPGKAR